MADVVPRTVTAAAKLPERAGGQAGHFVASRWYRPVMVGLAAPPLIIAIVVAILRAQTAVRDGLVGVDLAIVTELGRRWWESGTMYLPSQLAGPYPVHATVDLTETPALYPPIAGPFFAVAGSVPTVLWWLVPLLILGYLFWTWRPAPWTWPILALLVAWPETLTVLLVGGTTMWAVALFGAGIRWRWPAAFILLKPSLFPFALVGIDDRRWWVIAIPLVALSLPGAMDYLQVIANASGGTAYSIGSVPAMLLPLVAYAGRREASPQRTPDVRSTLAPPPPSEGSRS